MKKSNIITITIITGILLLGLILRLIGLDKPDGLWYDEMVMYNQAANHFPWGIIDAATNQDVHMPLYQLLLNLWMSIAGNDDIVIRFFSVILNIIAIIVMYFSGKEFQSKEAGFYAAGLLSINSLAIYYSQEVKFYSLLILLASISAFFIAKLKENSNTKPLIGFITINVLIVYTFSIGFIFAYLQFFFLIMYYLFKRKHSTKLYISLGLFSIFCIPFFIMFFNFMSKANSYQGGFSGFYFDLSFIFIAIQNLFSPCLTSLTNNSTNYLTKLFRNGLTSNLITFILLPIIFYIIGIIKSINNKNFVNLLLLTSLSFIAFEFIAVYTTSFKIVTRYTILILPFLILTAGCGFASMNKKKLTTILFSFFIALNIYYIFTNPYSAPKRPRPSGKKIPAKLLNECNFDEDDVFIFPIRTNILNKYYQVSGKSVSLLDYFRNEDKLKFILSKSQFKKLNKNNSYEIFQDFIFSTKVNEHLKLEFKRSIIDKLKNNHYLIIIENKNLTPYSPGYIKYLSENENLYKKQSLMFMQLSKLTHDIIRISYSYLIPINLKQQKEWVIYIFKKEHE